MFSQVIKRVGKIAGFGRRPRTQFLWEYPSANNNVSTLHSGEERTVLTRGVPLLFYSGNGTVEGAIYAEPASY